MSNDPTLEDALDGLAAATNYAEGGDLDDLAVRAASLYQELGNRAPDEDWRSESDTATSSAKIEIVHCGGCERRSLLEDVKAAADRDDTPIDLPHCPRCGTRVTYEATESVQYSPDENGREDLYRRAREEWGTDAQLTKAAEEFAEVAATINRLQNEQASRDDVLEELVDAQLMLEQLQLEYRDAEYQAALEEAIVDLEDRLDRYGGREVRADGGHSVSGTDRFDPLLSGVGWSQRECDTDGCDNPSMYHFHEGPIKRLCRPCYGDREQREVVR